MRVLHAVKKPVEQLQFADGTRLLLLVYGGRLLGLFHEKSEENFLWTHPALESVPTARRFYNSEAWHNSGGERTWLSPEIDLFLPDFPKTDRYFQPRQLDPGDYKISGEMDQRSLKNELTVNLSRSRKEVHLQIAREFGPAADPLRYEPQYSDLRKELVYAGCAQRSTLSILDASPDSSIQVGLWSLLQLPHGGEMLIPVFGRATPRTLLGKINPSDLREEDGLVRWKMRAKGEHKIGLNAVSCAGRIGYVHQRSKTEWDLVVRNFFVAPSSEYIDAPWSDPSALGCAVQACNVHSGLGSFSELEYHSPAVNHFQTSRADVSQLWAYRGSREAIGSVSQILLGVSP